jgi:hypothetical protein
MDKLKLKLQEYYQHCQQQEKRSKTGRKAAGRAVAPEMENDILLQFGLPSSKRFVQILHDFVSHSQVNDHLLDYVSKKLREAARKYLLAPVVSDIDQLSQAKDQKRSPYDLLPELGYPANEYAIFLVGELLFRRNLPATDILDELKKVQLSDSWEKVMLLSKIIQYDAHELYEVVKENDLRFVDEFVQYTRRQDATKTPNKKATPASEGYTPNFRTVTKIQIEEIVFDEHDTPAIVGKVKAGSRSSSVTIILEFSALTQALMSAGDSGSDVIAFIKKKLAVAEREKTTVIDLRVEFGHVLVLENCHMEIYKPQHRHGQKWVEDKDSVFFVEKILSKREFEKRTKEVEVKQKIQECLELIGGSYGSYQRLRRLGITDEEAKLRAGLQDELLFKLSTYLHKLKD